MFASLYCLSGLVPCKMSESMDNTDMGFTMKRITIDSMWFVALAAFLLPLCSLAQDRGIAVKAAADAGIGDYDPGRFHALVIGIDKYQNWNSLRCAVSDARSVADVLRRQYGYGDVKLLLDEQATRKAVLNAMDRYLDLDTQDSLLIFYAGHGWMDQRSQSGYWIPVEAERDDKSGYLSNAQIVGEYFRKYRVKHLLVIADSCFSGALMRGGESSRETGWELPAGYRKPSRWVMTSGDLAPVADDAGGGHSPFATRVLQFLEYSDSKAYGIQDLYVYVRKNLKSQSICQPLDTPAHMPGGEFVFCRLDKATGTTFIPAQTALPQPSVAEPVEERLYGGIKVKSKRAGKVTMDGLPGKSISAGVALAWNQLPVGTHRVSVLSDGRTWDRDIVVEEGKVQEVEATFGAQPGGDLAVDLGNDVKMEFVWIESLKGWVGKYEVTNEEYRRFKADHTSGDFQGQSLNGDRQPVVMVSYDDAVAFAAWINSRSVLPEGYKARLPDGKEWMTFAQCGDGREYPWGSEWPPKCGNYADASAKRTFSGWTVLEGYDDDSAVSCVVEKSGINTWGLYGVGGNVWEWTSELYGTSGARVLRGASWLDNVQESLRCSCRVSHDPSGRNDCIGFRLVVLR